MTDHPHSGSAPRGTPPDGKTWSIIRDALMKAIRSDACYQTVAVADAKLDAIARDADDKIQAVLAAFPLREGARSIGCDDHDACEGGPCKAPYGQVAALREGGTTPYLRLGKAQIALRPDGEVYLLESEVSAQSGARPTETKPPQQD